MFKPSFRRRSTSCSNSASACLRWCFERSRTFVTRPSGRPRVSLLPPRSALFLAALAAIAVLVHTIWQQISGHSDITAYASAGFLGLVLFTIAASASVLASRVRESEALVRQKDVDLANLADLSQYIVQHLRESLLVVDAADKIRLINESAAEILGDIQAVPGALVGEVSPRLLYTLSTWRQRGQQDDEPPSFVAADGARVIQPHFAPLGERPWADPDFPGGHEFLSRTGAAEQACCAGAPVREHRS